MSRQAGTRHAGLGAWTIALALTCSATIVRAEVPAGGDLRQAAPAGSERVLRFDATVARNAPAGDWSVGVSADFTSRLALSFAVGEDISGQHLRLSVAPRFRLITLGPVSADVAVALSYADGEEMGETVGDATATQWTFERRWRGMWRANPEVGVSVALAPRLSLRAFGGLGLPLTESSVSYWSSSDPQAQIPEHLLDRYRLFPYVGATLSLGVMPLGGGASDWPTLASPGRWYGWQLLAVDAVMASLALAFVDSDRAINVFMADTGGAAVLHVLHNRPGRAVASAALRTGLLFLGGIVGMAIAQAGEEPSYERDPFEGALPGALVGWGVAMLVDDLLLARD